MRKPLIARYDQGQYFWELRSCSYWQEFEQPKILYQEIATYQAFAWDDSGACTTNKTFLIPGAEKILLFNATLRSMLFDLRSLDVVRVIEEASGANTESPLEVDS